MQLSKTEKLNVARQRLSDHCLNTTRHRASKLIGTMAALKTLPGEQPLICETAEFDTALAALIALVPKLRPDA